MDSPDNSVDTACTQRIAALREEIGRVLVGQCELVDGMIIGLLCGGHVLMEGRPGLAKTLAVKTLAQCLGGSFARIQFTPDLLPADICGSTVFNQAEKRFEAQPGPIAANIVLADEINRAPAKVQSALLEAMQEQQVTIAGKTMALPQPFFVVATQNPIEHSGTYELPEAQKDRFMLQIELPYPRRDDEQTILDRMAKTASTATPKPVLSCEDVMTLRQHVDAVHIAPRLRDYVLDLVIATRPGEDAELRFVNHDALAGISEFIDCGASPRASLALVLASKAHALLNGRNHVIPHDIQACAPAVIAHRLVTSFDADAQKITPRDIVARLLDLVPAP
ncbi:MAG: MoxR family ATPase [Lentisphaeria bacterium]|nr:MoxR family ATPase [Lentisphaeria bacterium]